MKLVFLGTSSAIVYYMRYHRIIKLTYDKEQDTFKYLLLVAPSAVLALLTSHVYTVLEVCSLWCSQGSCSSSKKTLPQFGAAVCDGYGVALHQQSRSNSTQ
jgi:hypothetical protein